METERVEGFSSSTVHDKWMEEEFRDGLISVIVPTYNRDHYLPDLIESVFQQVYRPIELLIVDDGSTDNTERLIRKQRSQYTSETKCKLRYLYQENQGAQVARNRGLIESNGEFIQFLDSDDILHPQKFSIQTEALRRSPEASFVSSQYKQFQDGKLPPMKEYDPKEELSSAEHYQTRSPTDVAHPESLLYRRRTCSKIGPWDEQLERWQDWEYSFRIATLRLSGIRLPGLFYYGRMHESGSIGDLRYGEEGVSRNLTTLASIDRVIEKSDEKRPELHETAYRLYLNTLQRALASGTDRQIQTVFRRAKTHALDSSRRFRTIILELCYRLVGAETTRRSLKAYSRFKTGGAPAGNDPQGP